MSNLARKALQRWTWCERRHSCSRKGAGVEYRMDGMDRGFLRQSAGVKSWITSCARTHHRQPGRRNPKTLAVFRSSVNYSLTHISPNCCAFKGEQCSTYPKVPQRVSGLPLLEPKRPRPHSERTPCCQGVRLSGIASPAECSSYANRLPMATTQVLIRRSRIARP